jgi:hypothetical protein
MLWGAYRSGMREIDLYRRVEADRLSDPAQYPLLTWLVEHAALVVPPVRWELLLDEVLGSLDAVTGSAGPDAATERATVRAVQLALMPDHGRQFPATVDLAHDYASWYLDIRQVREAKGDWRAMVAPLASYGPGSLLVEDPDGANARMLGATIEVQYFVSGELLSPVARVFPRRHAVL